MITLQPSRQIHRMVLVLLVLVAVITWPEELNPKSLLFATVVTLLMISVAKTEFCKVFICTFSVSTIIAFTIYFLSAPLGLFQTVNQDALSGMTDSQFFLYEARRFIADNEISAFFSTWGGAVPVLYGVLALQLFGGHYVGIVFCNSILYTVSVFLAVRIFNLPHIHYRFLPFMGLLPLQGLYNAMLAKEPIYLFVTVVMLYSVFLFSIHKKIFSWNMFLFVIMLFVAIVFRPIGAIIVSFIALFTMYKKFGVKIFFYFVSIFILNLSIILIYLISIDYPIALFIISGPDGGGFSGQAAYQQLFMQIKGIPEFIQPIFHPPWSIILSPFLSILWLISPLPLIGGLIDSCVAIFDGSFRFGDLATIAKYLDAMIIFVLLVIVLMKKIKWWSRPNLIIIFLIIQIITIVMFNFFEASRHRYLPGFMIALFVLVNLNLRIKKYTAN
jgi:hypothetical protein